MARKSFGATSRSRGKRVAIQKAQRSVPTTKPKRSGCANSRDGSGNIRYHLRGLFTNNQEETHEGQETQEPTTTREQTKNENQIPQEENLTTYTVCPRPSLPEAILAKCCECSAEYDDGRVDCRHNKCPLYCRMPYRRMFPDFTWVVGDFSKKHFNKATKSRLTSEEYIALCLREYRTKEKNSLIIHVGMIDMIRAKCFSCCNNYYVGTGEKGRVDCSLHECSLYYWTPYRERNPSYDWMFDLPYTKRHRVAIAALGMSRDTYIKRTLIEGERL